MFVNMSPVGAIAAPPGGGNTPHAYWRIRHLRNFGPDGAGGSTSQNCDIAEIEMRAAVGGPDQCTGGTAIESGHFSTFVAANAFDNNTGTIWAAPLPSGGIAPNSWIGYQFASPVNVEEIYIVGGTEWRYATTDFLVESSDDGTTWTVEWIVLNATWAHSANPTNAFARPSIQPDPLGSYQYWRWRVYATWASGGPSAGEIEARATVGGADQCTGGTATASSSFNGSTTPDKAFDDSGATNWSGTNGQGSREWIQYQFASAVNVAQIYWSYGFTNESPRHLGLQYSSDGSTWYLASYWAEIPVLTSGQNFVKANDGGDITIPQ